MSQSFMFAIIFVLKDSVWCQIMIFKYSISHCRLTYSTQILRLVKNLMQKVYKTMAFEIILQKGIEKRSPFLTCPILHFDFHLQNGNIFLKTVCTIRKYSKIPPQLFQIKFSYLMLIKIFAII